MPSYNIADRDGTGLFARVWPSGVQFVLRNLTRSPHPDSSTVRGDTI